MAEVSRLLPGSGCQLISFPVGHRLFARVWFNGTYFAEWEAIHAAVVGLARGYHENAHGKSTK